MDRFTFEGTAKDLPDDEVGVWTDGLSLSNDHPWRCAYRLEIGKKYRVTVELLDNLEL